MGINKSANINIHPSIFAVVGTILGAILSILIEYPLRLWLEPAKNWLNNNGLLLLAITLLFSAFSAAEFCRHRHVVTLSKKSAVALGLMILLTIPIIFFSANQAGIGVRTSDFYLILIWMVLMAIAALFSAFLPGIGELVKSILIAISAISLGVAIGTCGVMLGGNVIDYGTPFPDATVVVMDHRYDLPSLSGNYPVKALTYVVVRDSNEISLGIPGIPKKELLCRISKYLEITFDGHIIPPDGEPRYFTLEGGKSYTLILK